MTESLVVAVDSAAGTVELRGSISDPDVLRLVEDLDEQDRRDAVERALRIGSIAMRNAQTAEQLNLVEKEFTRMKNEFNQTMTSFFGEEGLVARTVEQAFGDEGTLHTKIHHFFGEEGTFERMVARFVGDDGQLTKALDSAIGEDGRLAAVLESAIGKDGEFHRRLNDFLGDKGELRQALDREFGPDSGRVYALLNPEDGSKPLGKFRLALEGQFDPDKEGSALHKLKTDMRQAFDEIKTGLRIAEAEEAARQKGTSKGRDFESVAFDAIESLTAPLGDRAEHMGDDPGPIGDVGDVVVTINPEAVGGLDRAIVIEVKNRSVSMKGKASIYKELDRGMQNRNAQFGIAVVESRHAESFAPFRFAAPNYILVELDEDEVDSLPLACALQMARAMVAARSARSDTTLDFEGLQGHVGSIQSQLETIQAMKTGLTGAETNIKNVKSSLDALRDNVRDAVKEILDSIAEADIVDEDTDG